MKCISIDMHQNIMFYYTGMNLWTERGKRQMQKEVATGTQNKRFSYTTISKTKTSLTNPLSRIQVGTARTPPQEIFAEFVGKRKFIFLSIEHNGRS